MQKTQMMACPFRRPKAKASVSLRTRSVFCKLELTMNQSAEKLNISMIIAMREFGEFICPFFLSATFFSFVTHSNLFLLLHINFLDTNSQNSQRFNCNGILGASAREFSWESAEFQTPQTHTGHDARHSMQRIKNY